MSSEKPTRNIAAWIIVALIVAALALGLSMPQLGPSQGSGGEQTLVNVYGHKLGSGDWNYQFRLLANTLGGFNPKDEAQQKRVRAREAAVETLVERELAYQAAQSAGLASVVADAEQLVKDGQIMSVGTSYMWRRPEEPFNYDGFRRGFLPQFLVNERDYLEHQRRASLARTFYDLVLASAVISEPELRAYYESDAERLGLRSISFDPAAFEPAMEPSKQALQDYIAKHSAELEKTYEEQKARYQGLRPQLDLSLIKIDKGDNEKTAKTKAKGLIKSLRKGDFAKLARENSTDEATALKGGHYGFVDLATAKDAPGSIDVDKEVLSALATLKPGSTSGLVEGEKAYYIVRAGEKREGDVAKEAVLQELASKAVRSEMAKEQAKKAAQALLTKLESGQTLDKILEAKDGVKIVYGPKAQIKPATQTLPSIPRGEVPPQFTGKDEVIEKAWSLGKPGAFLPEVYELGNRFVVAEVQSLEKASDEGFAEKKEELREQLTRQRADAQLHEIMQSRCKQALAKGDVAPNGVRLRQLFSYGPSTGTEPPAYNICERVGTMGRDLRYATMMQRLQAQMGGAIPGQG